MADAPQIRLNTSAGAPEPSQTPSLWAKNAAQNPFAKSSVKTTRTAMCIR